MGNNICHNGLWHEGMSQDQQNCRAVWTGNRMGYGQPGRAYAAWRYLLGERPWLSRRGPPAGGPRRSTGRKGRMMGKSPLISRVVALVGVLQRRLENKATRLQGIKYPLVCLNPSRQPSSRHREILKMVVAIQPGAGLACCLGGEPSGVGGLHGYHADGSRITHSTTVS